MSHWDKLSGSLVITGSLATLALTFLLSFPLVNIINYLISKQEGWNFDIIPYVVQLGVVKV